MMPSRALIVPAVLLLALSACSKQGATTAPAAGGNAATNVLAKAASAVGVDVHPQAGRWEATVKINKLDMPGLTPQMHDSMIHAMAAAPVATCLTAAQAARPAASFFSGQNNACHADNFSMTGGQLHAVLVCAAGPTQMKMTMDGTYSADSYEIHNASTASLPGGRELSQDMTVSSKRVGDCNGSEANAGHQG